MTPPLKTTLVLIDYGHPGKYDLRIPETLPGYLIEDAVDDILSGALHGHVRGVYVVEEGKPTRVVSEEVADKIAAAWIAGRFVSDEAREFIDYMGREVKEAVE
jgi:hypothetical protein